MVARAWNKTLLKLQCARTRWLNVKGPVGVVQATLLDFGWCPLEPTLWMDHEGESWELVPGMCPEAFVQHFARHVHKCVWRVSPHHHLGSGLQKGRPDLTAVQRFRKGIKHQPQLHGMALAVATAAVWPRARQHDAGYDVDPMCPRCKLARETPPCTGTGSVRLTGNFNSAPCY